MTSYQYTYAYRNYLAYGHGGRVMPAIWFRYDLSPITGWLLPPFTGLCMCNCECPCMDLNESSLSPLSSIPVALPVPLSPQSNTRSAWSHFTHFWRRFALSWAGLLPWLPSSTPPSLPPENSTANSNSASKDERLGKCAYHSLDLMLQRPLYICSRRSTIKSSTTTQIVFSYFWGKQVFS